jgi:succinate dehydrogenase/fumarate reductase-like Fe-S protein
MPYEHLLPAASRGRNERIDEAMTANRPVRNTAPRQDRRQASACTCCANPRDPATPRMQTYELDEADGDDAVHRAERGPRDHDPSLSFDFVCRAGICGSCGMMINGRPGWPAAPDRGVGPDITLAPLPVFELIADLSVNTGKWMRAMSERLQTWVHSHGAGSRPDAHRGAWTRNSPSRSTSSTAASSAAAAWPPAAPRACARTSSARSA